MPETPNADYVSEDEHCGCCGVEKATTTHLDDDYWCKACRGHVLAPPGWT